MQDKYEQANTIWFAYLHPFLSKCGMCGQSGDGGTGSACLCGLIIQLRKRTGGSCKVLWGAESSVPEKGKSMISTKFDFQDAGR